MADDLSKLAKGTNSGFSLSALLSLVDNSVKNAKSQLAAIKDAGSNVSVGNMFSMQMLMNRLSQMSEMSTAVVSASNQSISSMARNVK